MASKTEASEVPGASGEPVTIVFLCTGNAARSVMATAIGRSLGRDHITIIGAGTHSIEGLPMSSRTRNALRGLGHEFPQHRSHQFGPEDAAVADLIVAFEPGNVAWIRRTHPEVADRTATLVKLVADLAPTAEPLADRIATLQLASAEVPAGVEVVDPAGGEQDVFDACVAEVDALVRQLFERL